MLKELVENVSLYSSVQKNSCMKDTFTIVPKNDLTISAHLQKYEIENSEFTRGSAKNKKSSKCKSCMA